MFNLLWDKKKREIKSPVTAVSLKLDWLEPLLPIHNSIPRPNWEAIHQRVADNHKDNDQDQLWCKISARWAHSLGNALENRSPEYNYSIAQTDNFILVSSESDRYNSNLSSFLERCRKRLLAIYTEDA